MVSFLVYLVINIALFSVFALGLNLQWGFAGLINFGHVAFMAVGVYGSVLLTMQGVALPVAVAIGMALAALLGLFIGMSTLRLREDYLAIVTIGVSELVRLGAKNEAWLTKGAFGLQGYPLPLQDFYPNNLGKLGLMAVLSALAIYGGWQVWRGFRRIQLPQPSGKMLSLSTPPSPGAHRGRPWGKGAGLAIAALLLLTVYGTGILALLGYDLEQGQLVYEGYSYKAGLMLVCLVILTVVYGALEYLVHSPWGRVLKAIREDEDVATTLGKNVFWYKLQAFMLGGAIAGLAGSLYAWQQTAFYPDDFQPLFTFNTWTIVVLGGAGSNPGTLLGAVIFWAYDTITRFPKFTFIDSSQMGALRIMVIGLILMGLMVWRPQGLLGNKDELTLGK